MVDFSERPELALLQHGVVLFVVLVVGFTLAGAVAAALAAATLPEKTSFLRELPRLVELTTLLVGVFYAVKVGTE